MYVLVNNETVLRMKEGVTLEYLRNKYPEKTFIECEAPPDWEELEDMINDAVASCPDSCSGIEPDGTCRHGVPAWPRALKLM